MDQLTIITDDKVGLLADISYILGKSKINIDSLLVVSMDKKAILTFYVKDAKKASVLLKANGYNVLESEVLVVKLRDQPGEISRMFSILAQNNVNILNLYFVAKEKGHSIVAVRVDRTRKAKRLLAPYLSIDKQP